MYDPSSAQRLVSYEQPNRRFIRTKSFDRLHTKQQFLKNFTHLLCAELFFMSPNATHGNVKPRNCRKWIRRPPSLFVRLRKQRHWKRDFPPVCSRSPVRFFSFPPASLAHPTAPAGTKPFFHCPHVLFLLPSVTALRQAVRACLKKAPNGVQQKVRPTGNSALSL